MDNEVFFRCLIIVLAICLLVGTMNGVGIVTSSGLVPTVVAQTDEVSQAEAEAYRIWYITQLKNDSVQAINLAKKYLDQYPTGKYAEYLSRWIRITIKRDSLYAERKQAAEKYGLTSLFEETRIPLLYQSVLDEIMVGRTDVNVRIEGSKTALMLAAAAGDSITIKALIKKGADVNAAELSHGWTALIYAIWNRDTDSVRALLEVGADLNRKDKEGRSAVEHAKISIDPEVIEIIERTRHSR